MTALAVANRIRKDNIVPKLKEDLDRISKAIKTEDFTALEFPPPEDLAEILRSAYELSLSIDKATALKEVQQLLRLFIFLIKQYKTKIYPVSQCPRSQSLDQAMQAISDDVGVVPCLKSAVALPNDAYLPKKFSTETKAKWQQQVCSHPSRGNAVSHGEIHFITCAEKTSVRIELEKRATENKIDYVDVGQGRLFLNLIDFEYFYFGLMDADHFQSSVSLIERLKEMIMAMNLDPKFREEMENSSYNDGYFLTLSTKEVAGNYWLYMVYHNSMQNLWFLLSSDNSGGGKIAADPVEWLKTTDIGHEYLEYLKAENLSIDKSDVLYKVSDGMPLKDSFTDWVRKNKKDIIKVCRDISLFEHTLREQVISNQRSRKHLRNARLQLHLSRDTIFQALETDSDSSFPSLASSDSEEHKERVKKELEKNLEYQEIETRKNTMIRETAKAVAETMKSEKRGAQASGLVSIPSGKKLMRGNS